jgi:nucleobase transporter 1/2
MIILYVHVFHIPFVYVLQVASRLVFTVFPCILILFGIIGKVVAVFITIPYPVLGGVQIIGFGMFIGLVMSNLQYIDMQSTRNLAIIGVNKCFFRQSPWDVLHYSI